jgi:hypothetical protein
LHRRARGTPPESAVASIFSATKEARRITVENTESEHLLHRAGQFKWGWRYGELHVVLVLVDFLTGDLLLNRL